MRYVIRYKDQEFKRTSRFKYTHAVVSRARAYRWNSLGITGHTDHKARWSCNLFTSQDLAEAFKAKLLSKEFGPNLSNAIGNNDHLKGVCPYDDVAVLRVEVDLDEEDSDQPHESPTEDDYAILRRWTSESRQYLRMNEKLALIRILKQAEVA